MHFLPSLPTQRLLSELQSQSYQIYNLETMKTLVERLTEQTQPLKEKYIEMTKEWAQKDFARMLEQRVWTNEQWAKRFNVELVDSYPGKTYSKKVFPRGFYNTARGGDMIRLRDKISVAARMGEDAFIAKAEKNAISHYHGSIQKLAYRIEAKGLNTNNLKLQSTYLGVNFETIITDGSLTVRAWTIIASGPIQRPHYRYLVK